MAYSDQTLVIHLENINDLLIPPQQDFLSKYDYIQSGEAALPHAIQFIDPKRYKDISYINICLRKLNEAQINLQNIRNLIHHFLNFQITDNKKKMIIFKQNTSRIFRNAVIFLIVCMAIVTLIGTESFLPHLPPLMRSVLVEGFTVVGWVIMWRPIELILNQWTGFKIQNQIYQRLVEAEIKVTSNTSV